MKPLSEHAKKRLGEIIAHYDGMKTPLMMILSDYLGHPNSEKAHHLLHTHYHARTPFPRLDDK